jgi:hypothetical protein
MTNETTPAATPAVTPGSTPAQAATNPPELQAGDGQQEPLSLEEAKKLRKEAQALRTRLKNYEEAEAAAAAAKLSESERLQQQYAKLQADHDAATRQYQEQLTQLLVEREAAKLGVRPEAIEDVVRLLDWAELQHDDSGKPTNAGELIAKLLKNKPYLAATPPTPAQPGTPTLPAMNPGRASIPSPGQLPPGQRPKLSDLLK